MEELYFRVDDIVNRYKGQIECWDVFNEPLHGDSHPNGEIFIEAFGEGIWNEIMERVKVIFYSTKLFLIGQLNGRSDWFNFRQSILIRSQQSMIMNLQDLIREDASTNIQARFSQVSCFLLNFRFDFRSKFQSKLDGLTLCDIYF